MKLLVVGSGGREHAIAKKLLESRDVEQVFVAPGNDGMTLDGLDLVNIGISEHSRLIEFAKENDIAWSFIGPDDALVAGIVDDFNQAGLKAFGPSRLAAELEWSKYFAKEIMVKYVVPTAAYGTFSDFEEAKAYIEKQGAPIVVKADGLALGKGVVIEEFLDGEEFSLFAFVNGDKFYILPTAQDHKRAYDGDKGPNTGGMGAYAPVPHLPQSVVDQSVEAIIKPVLKGMIAEGRPYLDGAALASDAFFPFADNIEEIAAAGIKAIIQPGGSVRDEESIIAADKHSLTMIFTGVRHFRH